MIERLLDVPKWGSREERWAAKATVNCVWVVYQKLRGRRGERDSFRIWAVWLLESEAKRNAEDLNSGRDQGFTYYGVPLYGAGAWALRLGLGLAGWGRAFLDRLTAQPQRELDSA